MVSDGKGNAPPPGVDKNPPPPPPPHEQKAPPPPQDPKHKAPKRPPPPPSFFAHRARKFAAKSLRFGTTVFGIALAANVASHYYEHNQVDDFFGNSDSSNDKEGSQSDDKPKANKSKKSVLVLPFQNLKVVERRSGDLDDLKRLGPSRDKQPTIVLEAKELVKIIHTAAADPNITALHADFGEGMRFPCGLGHMEEIRNAIRVFNESHRAHRDPNINHNPVFAMPRNGDPKPSYAFGHSFQWNEYFLASSFTYVHLQSRGALHLFGVTASNTFFRSALNKYGIKAHVFKHGDYKTAPNVFTEDKYSKQHLEAVKAMTASLNSTICSCIEKSRDLNFDSVMWKSIFDYGSLTSANSAEIGLVDSLFPVDPLLSLLHANKEDAAAAGDEQKTEDTKDLTKAKKAKLEEIFGLNKSFDKFVATEQVSLVKYHEMIKKKAKLEERRKYFTKLAESSTAASFILSTIGLAPREVKLLPSKVEKVAVVTVDGSIGSALSYETIEALRKIRADDAVKCLVLRVNSPGGSVISSEAILEELKILGKPIVCSMSNAAASGGYYISTSCEKIFANPTSITGSIGVFGVKFDASKWAKGYGIRTDYYPHGSHAASLNPLVPLTPGTKDNITRMVAGFYDYFKNIVATSRSMSVDEVEQVAQGRVWTGEQAKEVGLVDRLGGLDRAVSYAKSTHTKSEYVDVEYWPRKKGLWDFISGKESLAEIISVAVSLAKNSSDDTDSILHLFNEMSELKFADRPHFMLTIDEKTALDLILGGD
eukprot:CAMPEP_0201694892 /NCGR_PEP_ID=MMETSP0578-20130828/6994_1 /ASSEMBLY_ACC=CAM_ASM_000663 /TAXON_ID=267565 /ORGANISM="Skeletonema grethea, Strain CCMP 1804" /LENGTH=764 /DNA_ID=CAMNT_0048180625 /DNA_START=33 /DNA_END=2327 /DNA_ORIENTATION=-